MGSTFPEDPSDDKEGLFPVTAHLPGEEQVCCGCGALRQAHSASVLGLVLCPCSPAFPDAQLAVVSWECFAFARASPKRISDLWWQQDSNATSGSVRHLVHLEQ